MPRFAAALCAGLLICSFALLAAPSQAAVVTLVDPGVDLSGTRAIVRDVGEFRFAVFPDEARLESSGSRLDLAAGEELFLVEFDAGGPKQIAIEAGRTIVQGTKFALIAATAGQTRVLDTLSICRERITWIEPIGSGHGFTQLSPRKVDAQVKDAIVSAVTEPRFSQLVRELSGNIVFWLNGSLEFTNNRYTHTAGSGDDIDIAAAYLEDRFSAAGYTVTRQPFNVSGTTTDNILAIKVGTTFPDEIVVVGAHYDTISENPSSLAPGAEDNGSGTAGVLQLAEIFADYETERTIHFVCFSGEEQGLFGSQHYVSEAAALGWNVIGALTMDMIAAWESNYKVIIEGQTPWETLMSLFESNVNAHAQIASRKDYFSFGSDHVPFQQAGIPAFLAIDWDYSGYDHYHRTTDTWQYLDTTLGQRIVKAMAGTLADMTNPMPIATPAPELRARFALEQNSPNPFNPRTVIRFQLDRPGHVSLKVYDLAGRHVRTVVDTSLEAGPHRAQWDGTDMQNRGVSSGNYLLRLQSDGRVLTRRMALVR